MDILLQKAVEEYLQKANDKIIIDGEKVTAQILSLSIEKRELDL